MAKRKGRFDCDWIGGKAQRFVIPMPAVPTCDRKKRFQQDRDFYLALLTCYEPHERPPELIASWQLSHAACKRLDGIT